MEGVIVTIGVILGGTWINLVIIHTKHFSNVTIYLLELFSDIKNTKFLKS